MHSLKHKKSPISRGAFFIIAIHLLRRYEIQAEVEEHRVSKLAGKIALVVFSCIILVHYINPPIVTKTCLHVEPNESTDFLIPHDPRFEFAPLDEHRSILAVRQSHGKLVALKLKACLKHV